jgi:hypothetical protein
MRGELVAEQNPPRSATDTQVHTLKSKQKMNANES